MCSHVVFRKCWHGDLVMLHYILSFWCNFLLLNWLMISEIWAMHYFLLSYFFIQYFVLLLSYFYVQLLLLLLSYFFLVYFYLVTLLLCYFVTLLLCYSTCYSTAYSDTNVKARLKCKIILSANGRTPPSNTTVTYRQWAYCDNLAPLQSQWTTPFIMLLTGG